MKVRQRLIRKTIDELVRRGFPNPLFKGDYYADGENGLWGRLRAEMSSKTNNNLTLDISVSYISRMWQFIRFCEEGTSSDYDSVIKLPLEIGAMSQYVSVNNSNNDCILGASCTPLAGSCYEVTSLNLDVDPCISRILKGYRARKKIFDENRIINEDKIIKDIIDLWEAPNLKRAKKQDVDLYFGTTPYK